MNHKTAFVAGTVSGAVCVGLIGGLFASPALALLGLAALNGSFIALSGESKENKLQRELDTARTQLAVAQSKSEHLDNKLADAFKLLENFKVSLTKSEGEKSEAIKLIQELQVKAKTLHEQLAIFQENYSVATDKIEELESDLDDWRRGFREKLEQDTEKVFQQRVDKIVDDNWHTHDAITREAMQLLSEYQSAASQMREAFERKNEEFQDVKHFYAKNLKEFNELFCNERDAYLNEIDLLRGRIAQMQHELAGDLIEPELLSVAYSIEGRIANDIAKEIFSTLQIPLAVKGYHTRSDGSTDVGYGFSRSMGSVALVDVLKRHSDAIAQSLRIHKITTIKKLEIDTNMIVLTFRREPALKDDGAKQLAGTAEEFLKYVVTHPIRYRLIADPGAGKTPTTAVMLSAILKEGCRRGNTVRGKKVDNTLVTVSYPDAQSSLKDSDYPLEMFLKYGTTTAAIKSFDEALEDWQYRKQNVKFAEEFFHIRVWDELDNTINSADDAMGISEKLKKVLKQGGHSNIGWIVSGQSVMTSQIKGFKDDDRSLFTEIIIGIPKIRMYVKKYARGKNSDANLAKLERNLDDLESYIESINDRITDDARLLRIALIVDDKSPKLYFLPNLDNVDFDEVVINESVNKAAGIMLGRGLEECRDEMGDESSNAYSVNIPNPIPEIPFPTMQGVAHCPHCGNSDLSVWKDERYYCKNCKKKSAASKVVFK